jgi:hypothetical protein
MKNCIVLSGQFRTFDKTVGSIKQFIQMNDLDVYCHLWSKEQNEIDFVIDNLNPKEIVYEDYEKHSNTFTSIEERILKNNPKGPNQDKLAANASMNYGRKVAYSLVPKEEYETIIYCRYDNRLGNMLLHKAPDFIITPLEESYNLISDIFAVMPRNMADSYFLFDEYERLHSTPWEPEFLEWLRNVKGYPEQDIQTHIHTRYCPHLMLMRNIIMSGNNFQIVNLPVVLQR